MTNNTPQNPILVALDTPNFSHAFDLTKSLVGKVGGIKLGLEFFYAHGLTAVKKISALGIPVFFDLKLSDIPNTVNAAICALLPLEPFMINIHTLGGKAMMLAAVKAVNSAEKMGFKRPLLIGVTIVTSMDNADMGTLGIKYDTKAQVVNLAKLAQNCGLDGVVCSPHEISAIKAACGHEFKTIVPGIRPKGSAAHDQKRIMTPQDAIAEGADYLVIGRAITQAKNPLVMANEIWDSIRVSR